MEIEEYKKIAKEGRRDEAIEMLRQMLERNEGEREEVLLELGCRVLCERDTNSALNHLNEVMRINPGIQRQKTYLDMINGILNYYCKDLLNP